MDDYDIWQNKDTGSNASCLAIRDGLDEATLLRVILCSSILKELQIEATDSIVEKQVKNLSRKDAMFSFLEDLDENQNLLLTWLSLKNNSNDGLARVFLIYGMGLTKLTSKEAVNLLPKLETSNMESGLHTWIDEYIDAVRLITDMAYNFDSDHESLNAEDKLTSATDFLGIVANLPESAFIRNAPRAVQTDNLKLILANPCYC